ncbi:hypothetical protein ILYODFUR_037539 [Ilyodon furcidens]|uniref:Uncharacterized protein n=1 Tax=Ilyodon furcidens TaxID=33524 RepID=A0ABV0UZC9_9TELE
MVGHWEAGVHLQQSIGGRRVTLWTGRRSIAGQHGHTQDKQPCTHSLTPKGNLEEPINLTVMFLDSGRKPEYPKRTHACTGKTCKVTLTFLLQGNSTTNCATVQPSQ